MRVTFLLAVFCCMALPCFAFGQQWQPQQSGGGQWVSHFDHQGNRMYTFLPKVNLPPGAIPIGDVITDSSGRVLFSTMPQPALPPSWQAPQQGQQSPQPQHWVQTRQLPQYSGNPYPAAPQRLPQFQYGIPQYAVSPPQAGSYAFPAPGAKKKC